MHRNHVHSTVYVVSLSRKNKTPVTNTNGNDSPILQLKLFAIASHRPFPPELMRKSRANVTPSTTACWASAGYNAAGCAALETQLRQCMDGPKTPPAPPVTVNYHLKRMQKHVTMQGKRK